MDAPAVTLASLRAGQRLRGVLPGQPVTLVGVTPLDDALVEIFFRDDTGRTGERMITDADAGKLELVTEMGNAPAFDGDDGITVPVAQIDAITIDSVTMASQIELPSASGGAASQMTF